jgi:hypothetical protein
MVEALEERAREQERLIGLARTYVESLALRVHVLAAVVVGSVARGDFNMWSDVDVVVVAESLPERAPERGRVLAEDAPGGVQPVGFTRTEFEAAVERGSPLATEAASAGFVLLGAEFLASGAS